MGRVRKGRDIDAALQKKGFLCESNSDHVRYYLLGAGGVRVVVQTKMSHGMGGSTLSVKLISLMARQLHLTKARFLDLIDCPLDETAYREILRDQGFDV